MRSSVFLGLALAAVSACADAQITAEQLQEDGRLQPNLEQRLFSAPGAVNAAGQAVPVELQAGLLALNGSQEALNLDNAIRVDQVHALQLRVQASGLQNEAAVRILWSRVEDGKLAVLSEGRATLEGRSQDPTVADPGADSGPNLVAEFELPRRAAAGLYRVEVLADTELGEIPLAKAELPLERARRGKRSRP